MMVENHNCILEPEGFVEVVMQHTSRFEIGHQNDAQEFLVYLLDMIHEDLNRADPRLQTSERKETIKATNLSQSEMEEAAKSAWKNYLVDNKSIIVDIFQGQIKSMIRCLSCNTSSTTFDPVMYFSLPLPENLQPDQELTIQNLLKVYTQTEKLDHKIDCKICEKRTLYEKKIDLWKAPNILIIHLKRFKFENSSASKIGNMVHYDVKNLDISEYFLGFQRVKAVYNLFAVCVGCSDPGARR